GTETPSRLGSRRRRLPRRPSRHGRIASVPGGRRDVAQAFPNAGRAGGAVRFPGVQLRVEVGWHSGAGRRGRGGLAVVGPPAGRVHGPLSGAGRPPPPAGGDAGGRGVGSLRCRRPSRSAAAVAPARLNVGLEDRAGTALLPGAVRAVRPALSPPPLPA